MTNDFIDGGTAGFGKSVVIEGRRVGSVLDNGVVHEGIDFVRGHARLDGPSGRVEDVARQLRRPFHFLNFERCLDLNHPRKGRLLLLLRYSSFAVIGFENVRVEHDALFGYFSGTEVSGVRKGRGYLFG